MPAPDSSSDYDVPERLLAALRLLGMNEVRARWKIIRFQRWWRRLRQDLAPASRRFDREICQSCGTLQAKSVAICASCGKRVGTPVGSALRRAGLSIPTALSVSSALGVVMVAIYARMMVARPGQGILTWDIPTLVEFGGDYPPAVHAGEWWRLGTAIFLHIGLWHIGFNLLALAQIGPTIEDLFGRGRMLAIFLLTGILANVGSELCGTYGVSAGASGAIMGLIGVAAGWGQRAGTTQGRAVRDQMVKWTVYTLVFGHFIGANNWAHLFGFLSGAALGFAGNPYRLQAKKSNNTNAVLGAVGIAVTGAFAILCLRPPASSRAMAAELADAADADEAGYDEAGYDEGDEAQSGAWTARIDPACALLAAGKVDEALVSAEEAVPRYFPRGAPLARETLESSCAVRKQLLDTCAKVRDGGLEAALPGVADMDAEQREAMREAYESMCAGAR
jgi:membrane associated rhomboid family serine protease